jgi:predicted ATPase/class 3 adenylate cyclase
LDEELTFGQWLRRSRKARDLTQTELAGQVSCGLGTIRKLEADELRPSKELAERLAAHFGVPELERAVFVAYARGQADAPLAAARPPVAPALVGLPSGTVTFLFTDIEGSTQLWERHPQAMPAALARHDARLRELIDAHGGMVFKTVGDGCHAVFVTAAAALAATLAAQRALIAEQWETTEPLRVRMALHTGAADLRDGDYFGPPLNRVARLLVTGHGGQILLTRATQELVRDDMPADAELLDLGRHRLKDLAHPEQIFQLLAPNLPTAFPPLNALDAHRTNLPAQPTPLIGRDQEVAAVCSLLRRTEVHLLTLTGPGGTGKTRLGLQVAAELLDAFVDGIYFVNLAPIRAPDLVASAIAQTLGLTERGDQSLLDRVHAYLRDKRLLLLLDNFEQVVDAAPLVAALLGASPQLKLLVTSRAPLQLRGEQEIPVPPLALPDLHRLPDLATLAQYAAVALFIQRAREVRPDFAVTNATAPAVAEICHRLDGLPLAIELAATRVKLLPLSALLARLDNRLRLLTGGARDLPARQQTIRATIAWSYDLLDAGAQTLFRRLAVFVRGCTPEAAEAVCGGVGVGSWGVAPTPNSQLPTPILDGLALLVDSSLLKPEMGVEGEPRFVMLETIREFALERLAASGEREALCRSHATYYLSLAEAAESQLTNTLPHLIDTLPVHWRDRIEADLDNFRAVLAWSQAATGDLESGVRLAGALAPFWEARGYWSEGRTWLESLLAACRKEPPAEPMVKLWRHAANLARRQGEYSHATALAEECLILCQTLNDRSSMVATLRLLARLAGYQDDPDREVAHYEEYRRLSHAHSDSVGLADALCNLGRIALNRGDLTQATALVEESLQISRERDLTHASATALRYLGQIAYAQGDANRATALLDESVAECRKIMNARQRAWALLDLWQAYAEYPRAIAVVAESLAIFRDLGDTDAIAEVLWCLGELADRHGVYEQAETWYAESLAMARDLGQTHSIAMLLFAQGHIARIKGDYNRAEALYRESLKAQRSLGNKWGIAVTLHGLGYVALAHGDIRAAATYFTDELKLFREQEDSSGIAMGLAGLAGVAAAQLQLQRAARLGGAADVLLQTAEPLEPEDRLAYDQTITTVRAQLDNAAFAAAWAAGRALTAEQAIAYALSDEA